MSQDQGSTVKKSIVVQAPQARAFRVFTEGMDKWWPRSHKIGRTAMTRAVLEPRSGGRWYEIGEDGAECNWGKVVAYEPSDRLLLTWQISAAWQFDEGLVTEVEVRFTAQGERQTLVELEHRHLERFGAAETEMRKQFESPAGWGGILEGFRSQAQEV